MNPTTLLQISAGAIVLLFLINCFIAYKNIYAIAIMQQPGYRQMALKPADLHKLELARQIAQRNACFLNIAVMVVIILPLLVALLQINN